MAAGQHLELVIIPAGSTTPIVLTGFGHQPEVLIAFWNGRPESADALTRSDSRRGTGWAIGAGANDQLSWSHLMVDGVSANDTLAGGFAGFLISNVKATGPVGPPYQDGLVRVASFDPDGVTLAIDEPFSNEMGVILLSLGPDLITNKAIGAELFPGATGDQVITGLGFQPTGLLFFSTGREPSEPGYSQYCYGVAADDGASGVDQSLIVGFSRGVGVSSDTRRYCRRDYCLGLSIETPNNELLERRAALSSLDADGFTLSHDTINPIVKGFGWLALEGPGIRAGGTTVGDEVSGLSFHPRAALFFSAGQTESPDALAMQTDDISCGGLAVLNETLGLVQFGGCTRSDDAQPTMTIATRRMVTTILGSIEDLVAEPLGVADGETRVSFTNDGLDFETVDPWDGGDVYTGFMVFGAPPPIVTDGRLAIVPSGSQDPPVAEFTKDPSSVLDYAMNWDAPLSDETPTVQDSIVSSTWTAPNGITIEKSPPSSFTGNETRVWLSGGADNKRYDVVNQIKTLNGRVYERTIQITVEER